MVTRFGGVDEVWEWHPNSGWAAVPRSHGINPNGIEVSPDGRYYYIGGWAIERLYRLSREAPYEREELWVGYHIDNVHFDDTGRLLAAGHDAPEEEVFDCVLPDGILATDNSRCTDIISRVVRVDHDLRNDEEIFRYRTNELLPLGTAAIQVDHEIWIGGPRDLDRWTGRGAHRRHRRSLLNPPRPWPSRDRPAGPCLAPGAASRTSRAAFS